jgi:hypothetical protein
MNKAVNLVLTEEELLELYYILVDQDEAGALDFLDSHLRQRLRQVMEGG